jgi:hypothetical protein
VNRLDGVGQGMPIHRQRHQRAGHVLRGEERGDGRDAVQGVQQASGVPHVLRLRGSAPPPVSVVDVARAAQIVPVQRAVSQNRHPPVTALDGHLARTLRQRPLDQIWGQKDTVILHLCPCAGQHLSRLRLGQHDADPGQDAERGLVDRFYVLVCQNGESDHGFSVTFGS